MDPAGVPLQVLHQGDLDVGARLDVHDPRGRPLGGGGVLVRAGRPRPGDQEGGSEATTQGSRRRELVMCTPRGPDTRD